jgi:hypothetical protein
MRICSTPIWEVYTHFNHIIYIHYTPLECTPRFRTFSTFPTDLWAANFSYLLKNSLKILEKSVGMSIEELRMGIQKLIMGIQ